MMTEPLISIVMPAFNAGKTIKESIQSVIDQTYKNWELIVIDDCSKDDTYFIAEKFAVNDERIHLLKNSHNLGVSITRNKAVASANGSWIAFLDSDDMWTADKLQKQLDLVSKKGNADLIFTGSSFINSEGEPSKYSLSVPSKITYKELLKQNLISCSSVLIKKAWMTRYPMQYDGMHEDYAVWLQILREGGNAYGIDKPLLIYRLSNNSKSSNKKKAALMTYRVYRFIGLNLIQTGYYFCWYAWRNIHKYRAIAKNI